MWHVLGSGKVHTVFLWGKLRETYQLEKSRKRWEDNIQIDLKV
jgi:hypothetical protein